MEKKETIFEKDKDSEFIDEPEEFLEPGDEHPPQTDAEVKFHVGDKEADVYTEEGREELTVDEEEIKPWEEGFAQGAEGSAHQGTCAQCDQVLGDREEGVIEREYNNKPCFFCSEECANKGPKEN